jgi:hypothetical protein
MKILKEFRDISMRNANCWDYKKSFFKIFMVMSIKYVGGWIPTLDYIRIDIEKINAEKDEDIGDGVISKIKITLTYESNLKLKIYDCNDKTSNIILVVEDIKITETGIWFGKVKIYDDLDEKILEALIIRGEKFLKEMFHTHLYHDEDADYLTPPLILVKNDDDKKLKEKIVNHINNIYKEKFKIYIEFITNDELSWKFRR